MLSQDHRALGLNTALGEGVLFIERITGQESLGNLFEYSISAIAEKDDFAFDDLIGTDATVRLEVRRDGADSTRFFNGVISQIAHLGYDQQGNSRYELTLVPWLWFLSQGADCKIFQQKTVQEILEEVFKIVGIANYKFSLKGSYPSREYCVQYRESHLNFVQRLMQHEGIYYFWEHDDGEHKMVICDDMSVHKPLAGFEQVIYRSSSAALVEESYLNAWKAQQGVTPGIYAHNSFNFESPQPSPNTKLVSMSDSAHKHKQGDYEVYDNPSDYMDRQEGERYAEIRREEIQCSTKLISAGTNARGLIVGNTFQPLEVPRDDQSGEDYLIVAASFQASVGGFGSGAGGGGEGFSSSFRAMPVKDCVFRPTRAARIPRMQGPQTAIVSGPKAEEIYVDKFGRVKVQFHWDRYGEFDDSSSCWVRVSQAWAGAGWGGMAIPRIGQEVIVEFIEGDVDQPIITGRVYNGESMPGYDLPKEKTKTSIKSRSTPDGGGFNELRFEDKKGKEQLFLHAQKDKDVRVRNTSREVIGNEDHFIVKKDRFQKLESNEHRITEKSEYVEIQEDKNLKIEGDHTEDVHGDHSTTVRGDELLTIKGDENVKISKDSLHTVGKNLHIDTGADTHQKTGKNLGVEAGMNIHLKAGMNVVIEAGVSLTIKAGGSFITCGPSGVAISGPMLMLNSGGAALSGAGAKPKKAARASKPDKPEEAKKADTAKSGKRVRYNPAEAPATSFDGAAESGVPFCEDCANAQAN